MKVSPYLLRPSQNFLKPQTIRFILNCIKNGEDEKLPPDPIVRKDNEGNFIVIDGHNLIAVRFYRHEDIDIHLAHSVDDILPETSDANIRRNNDLMAKYNSVLSDRFRLHEEGIDSFGDLINLYPDLF